MRQAQKPTKSVVAGKGPVNCVSMNPFNEFLLVTAGQDTSCALWDLRNLSKRLHSLDLHSDEVYQCSWAPFSETILMTGGADRRVAQWDLSRIGEEQTAADAEDGPPELLFVHGGHTAKVSDVCWNGSQEWYVASVAEDNLLHVWETASSVRSRPDVSGVAEADLE